MTSGRSNRAPTGAKANGHAKEVHEFGGLAAEAANIGDRSLVPPLDGCVRSILDPLA